MDNYGSATAQATASELSSDEGNTGATATLAMNAAVDGSYPLVRRPFTRDLRKLTEDSFVRDPRKPDVATPKLASAVDLYLVDHVGRNLPATALFLGGVASIFSVLLATVINPLFLIGCSSLVLGVLPHLRRTIIRKSLRNRIHGLRRELDLKPMQELLSC